MKSVEIYTDGACSGNPGPGGWGAVLIYGRAKKELSGFEAAETTSNRMELTAAICALEALKESCNVNLYTDSAYLCSAFSDNWVGNWQKNGWKTSTKKPVENKDLWLKLIELAQVHEIQWHKVKGHNDNYYNNLCDKLATEQVRRGTSVGGLT